MISAGAPRKTKDYEQISISDLCDRLHVPRKSFYRYFSGKDGALAALIDHTLMEFEQPVKWDVKQRTGDAANELERYFLFWYEQKALLDALERSRLSGMLVERSTTHAYNEQLMPRYLKNLSADMQEMALIFAVCGLLAMVLQWHHGGYRQTPATMAQVATMMLTEPLIPGENG